MKVSQRPSVVSLNSSDRVPASEKCQQEKRKTVNGEDILFAMTSLGFENYAEALKIYLSKYREVRYPANHFFFLFSFGHKFTGFRHSPREVRTRTGQVRVADIMPGRHRVAKPVDTIRHPASPVQMATTVWWLLTWRHLNKAILVTITALWLDSLNDGGGNSSYARFNGWLAMARSSFQLMCLCMFTPTFVVAGCMDSVYKCLLPVDVQLHGAKREAMSLLYSI